MSTSMVNHVAEHFNATKGPHGCCRKYIHPSRTIVQGEVLNDDDEAEDVSCSSLFFSAVVFVVGFATALQSPSTHVMNKALTT